MTTQTRPVPQPSGRTGSSAPRKAVHVSREERAVKGKAAREAAPLASHADVAAGIDRPDPVGLLESQSPSRVPELVPIRRGRMVDRRRSRSTAVRRW